MRTNIVLNDDLLREAMRHSKATSKTALVEEALRTFVEVRQRELRVKTYADRVAALRTVLDRRPLRESAHEILKQDRERG